MKVDSWDGNHEVLDDSVPIQGLRFNSSRLIEHHSFP